MSEATQRKHRKPSYKQISFPVNANSFLRKQISGCLFWLPNFFLEKIRDVNMRYYAMRKPHVILGSLFQRKV